ncbi:hypothetical protein [Pedobacter nyackensis]|uniref:Uncharacterized protein n=1 Tax=Pedobacter nyackensis TaxID=475255 RepID=A0A1W1ZWD2_9SPHI|nr:hypothetical protein [Pedobacter nyackensis]SMC52717.1 hypothetical protein SAMN04488101_101105 [Pedobacter nyackensis]
MNDTLFNIFISVISSAGLTGIIIFFFKEKIKASIKSDYDHRLEGFKNELSKNQNFISKILDSQNHGYHLSQTDRIAAIKVFWENYLMIREYLTAISSIDGFMTVKETNEFFIDDRSLPLISTMQTDLNKSIQLLKQYQNNIEAIRPFINDRIWFQIVFLVTFLGRISYLYNLNFKNRNMQHWRLDAPIIDLLKKHLSEKEYDYITKNELAGIYKVISFVEQKQLAEIYRIINGRAAAEYSMDHAISLGQLQNDFDKETKNTAHQYIKKPATKF